jgi:hypothetical protein
VKRVPVALLWEGLRIQLSKRPYAGLYDNSPVEQTMSTVVYILLTVAIVLLYPVLQYRISSMKWKRIAFRIYLPCATLYVVFTVVLLLQSAKTERTLVVIRDYSAVATLDALGNPPGAGPGSDIKFQNELTSMLEGTFSIAHGKIQMRRDHQAEAQYREVIAKFPDFPFGYYYLALCLRERRDPQWREHAQRAVDILLLTTQINGHNRNHDEILSKLNSWLEEK